MPRLFVGQVPVDKQEEDLIPLFSAFGKVEKLSVVRGPDRKSRGCAMIQFERWADAEAALEATNGTSPFDGEDTKQLMVTFANPRRPGPVPVNETAIAPRKLFVTRVRHGPPLGLPCCPALIVSHQPDPHLAFTYTECLQIPKDTTPERLRDLFGQFGIVEQATIVPGKGPHGGCAFVRLSKWASCEAAIDALNEKHVMEGCKLPLMVKFAEARRGDGLGVPITKRGSGGSTSSSANGSVGSTSTRLQSPMHPGFMQYGHPMYSHNYVDGGDMAVVMGHPPGMHYAPYGGLPGVPGLLNPRRRDGQPAIGSGSSGRRALGSTDGGSTDSLVDNSSDACELSAYLPNSSFE